MIIFRFYTQDDVLSKGFMPFSLSFSDSLLSSLNDNLSILHPRWWDYFFLQVILPWLRSYGDNSTVTLSPSSILMLFIRSLPDMWACIWWPFSSSTLNIAFGNASTTTPVTSIASFFLTSIEPPFLCPHVYWMPLPIVLYQ